MSDTHRVKARGERELSVCFCASWQSFGLQSTASAAASGWQQNRLVEKILKLARVRHQHARASAQIAHARRSRPLSSGARTHRSRLKLENKASGGQKGGSSGLQRRKKKKERAQGGERREKSERERRRRRRSMMTMLINCLITNSPQFPWQRERWLVQKARLHQKSARWSEHRASTRSLACLLSLDGRLQKL